MISEDKIISRFHRLDEFLPILTGIQKTQKEAFLRDKLLQGAAKYYLQVSIECCLDIAGHIISSERMRAPKDYADAFSVLEENKVLGTELAGKLRQMAKFRNRLVHLYGAVDDSYVYDFIVNELQDFEDFKKAIVSIHFM